jgi:hypothetical protein
MINVELPQRWRPKYIIFYKNDEFCGRKNETSDFIKEGIFDHLGSYQLFKKTLYSG